jgi:hypothetical protein
MTTDYAAVLTARYPDAEWKMDGDTFPGLTWLSDGPAPTQAELDALWAEVAYERAYAQVEAARRARYQSETDGMFFAAQREGGDLTVWAAAVDQIKADLPYPSVP